MKFPDLLQYGAVCLDVETTGLQWWKDKVFGIAISADDRDWYFDIRKEPECLPWLREQVPRVTRLVNHHIKFDAHFCRGLGIHFPEDRLVCTMVRAALIDEHLLTYDLDALGKKYLGYGKDVTIYEKLAEMFGGKPTKNAQMMNLHRAPVQLAGTYAKQDTRTTLNLYHWQETEIIRQNLGEVDLLERQLIPVLIDIEYHGVRVDVDAAERAVKTIDKESVRMQKDLNDLAGFAVNPNPSSSIKQLFNPTKNDAGLWVLNDGTIAEPTDAGAASIDADCLRRMKHPAASMILELRQMLKTRDTFLKGHILGSQLDGIVHANFNQTKGDNDMGTGTGRLSCNAPALQQIHKRNKLVASVVRALFLPDRDHDWVCNDWMQMDFRVFSHYVNDRSISELYAKDPLTDFHQLTANMTGLPRSATFSGEPNAKQINLGLVFGMGKGRLAEEMGLPFTIEPNGRGGTWLKPGPEAEAVFDQYHSAIPGIGALLKNASSVAKSRGFVMSISGRRLRFPRGQFTHKAGGLVFQGSAADALKVKLVELHRYLKGLNDGSRLVLNVHDEFDTSIPHNKPETLKEINRLLEDFSSEQARYKFRIPVRTDQGIGPNWWEACK